MELNSNLCALSIDEMVVINAGNGTEDFIGAYAATAGGVAAAVFASTPVGAACFAAGAVVGFAATVYSVHEMNREN